MTTRADQFSRALSAQLRAEKSAADKTIGELAEQMNLSTRTLNRYFKGEREITASDLYLFSDAVGVDPRELIRRAMDRIEDF